MAYDNAASNVTSLPAVQAAQSAALRTVPSWRGVRPTTMDEAWKMAKALARAPNMLPRTYVEENRQPRPYEEIVAMVFSAIQMGAEVGLSPMASVQNIAVINGKPGLYGPAMLAVVEASGLLQTIEESVSGTMQERNMEGVCTVQRIGRQPRTFTFSYEDANLAKLIGKSGPWSQYPKRMFLARARTFALRDVFPDVLSGLSQSVEELLDIPPEDYREVKIEIPPGESLEEMMSSIPDGAEIEKFEAEVRDKLEAIGTTDGLDYFWKSGIGTRVREIGLIDKKAQQRIIAAFSQRKNDILKALEEAGETPEATDEASQDAPLSAEQEATLRQVKQDLGIDPDRPHSQIDRAIEALQKDEDPAQGKTYAKPPKPAKIEVPDGDDGKPDWNRWAKEALEQLKQAGNGEFGTEWTSKWLALNAANIASLRAFNADWAGRIDDLHAKVTDYLRDQEEPAVAEALEHFPTVAVEYKGENPDWIAFENNLYRYIRDTPNHRIAQAWWKRHQPIIANMAKAGTINDAGRTGAQAAADLKADLIKFFPQLAD